MTVLRRPALLLLVSALAVTCVSWCVDGPTRNPLARPVVARLLSARPPVAAAVALGTTFRLPRRDRTLIISHLITRDLDRDGDLDAAATTPDGLLLVWHNVGDNRLIRVQPDAAPLGRHTSVRRVETQGDVPWLVEERRFWSLSLAPAVGVTLARHGAVTLPSLPTRSVAHYAPLLGRGPPSRASSL